jgi:expansin (peptidoglycan-binding protein)
LIVLVEFTVEIAALQINTHSDVKAMKSTLTTVTLSGLKVMKSTLTTVTCSGLKRKQTFLHPIETCCESFVYTLRFLPALTLRSQK